MRYGEIDKTSSNRIFWSKTEMEKSAFLSLVSQLCIDSSDNHWLLGNKLPAGETLIYSFLIYTDSYHLCYKKGAVFESYRTIRFTNVVRIKFSIYF